MEIAIVSILLAVIAILQQRKISKNRESELLMMGMIAERDKELESYKKHPIIQMIMRSSMVIVDEGEHKGIMKDECRCPACTERRLNHNKHIPLDERLKTMSENDISTLLDYSIGIQDYETAEVIKNFREQAKK